MLDKTWKSIIVCLAHTLIYIYIFILISICVYPYEKVQLDSTQEIMLIPETIGFQNKKPSVRCRTPPLEQLNRNFPKDLQNNAAYEHCSCCLSEIYGKAL